MFATNFAGSYNLDMKRSGSADLPLHGGSVPPWLAERMTRLGTAIAENVIHHYGRNAFLSKLSDPSVPGFRNLNGDGLALVRDHDIGLGALKRGLNPHSDELGVFICGGRGRHSRKDPARTVDSMGGEDWAEWRFSGAQPAA